jgi:hypothetical protein
MSRVVLVKLHANQVEIPDEGHIAVFIDSADNLAKMKFSNGVVVPIGSPGNVDLTYNRTQPMIITVGGATVGTTFNGDIKEALDKILYPFVDPTTTFSISSLGMGLGISSGKTFEKGGIVQSVLMNFSVSENSDIFLQHSIQRGINAPDVIFTPNGSFNKTGLGITFADTLANRTFQLTTTFDLVIPVIKSDSIGFVAPSFFGVGFSNLLDIIDTIDDLNSVLPSSKELRNVKNKSNVNFNPVLQRYFFVYPASLGNLVSIIDQNGFNVTASFTLSTKLFTLIDGVTQETYNIYRSNDDTTQTNFKITFN